MSKIYQICSGSVPVNYTVSLTGPDNACMVYYDTWTQSGQIYTRSTVNYRFTSDIAVPSDLTINYQLTLHLKWYTTDPGSPYNTLTVTTSYTATIPVGGTYVDVPVICYDDNHNSSNGFRQERDTFTLNDQGYVPTCAPPPPVCHLILSSVVATDPSIRGASDGQIVATVSGYTGSTITWYINSVVQSGTATSHTFTGLATGEYVIKATEGPCWVEESSYIGEGEFRTGDFTVVSPQTNNYIVAVENPVLLNLGTAINSVTPQYSVNTFNITGAISNVVIDFNLTFPYSYSAEFRSKAYPDKNNYFLESILKNGIGTTVGNNNAEEIATSLAGAFQSDPIISRIYYISNSGSSVTLTSKEFSSEYDLNTGINITITGSNLTLTNNLHGVAQYDGQLSPDYSLYGELFVDNTIQYGLTPNPLTHNRVIELELPFNKSNLHQFDFSSTLKNYVSSPKIDFLFTGCTFMGSIFCSYYMKYGEKYPLVTGSNTKKKRYKGQTTFGWAMNSSLPFESSNDMSYYFGDIVGIGVNNVPFLNTAENTKTSHRNAKEYMSIVISDNYANALRVYGNIYLYNGTVISNVNLFDITTSGHTSNFGGVAILAVGYNDLGLSTYESSSKIRRIDIQVKQLSSGVWYPYSQVQSYNLDIDEQPNNYDVAFLNSLGTYETYTFIGELQETQVVTRNAYQKPYPIDTSGAASVGFQYNSIIDTEYTKTYTLNTGIIDADTYYFLQGMLQSNRIYHYDDQHQNYLNITAQTSMKSSNTNEYTVQLTVSETISENQVTQ